LSTDPSLIQANVVDSVIFSGWLGLEPGAWIDWKWTADYQRRETNA